MKPHLAFFGLLALLLACENHDIKPQQKPTRLKSVTSYFEHQQGNFQPASKTVYVYDKQLSQKLYYTYDIIAGDFSLFSTSTFTFDGDKLAEIVEDIGTVSSKTTTFQYENGILSSIHIDDEIDTDVSIVYLEGDKVVEAVYTHSNGRSFKYRMSMTDKNIVSEQTFGDDGNLSSEITNEFDAGVNPYSLLGYYDPFFSNSSRNNKKVTESEYYSSAFPEMVPVAYVYTYNEKNLPTEQVTTYKTYPNGQTSRNMKNVFEYEN